MVLTLRPAGTTDIEAIARLHRATRLACFTFMRRPHNHTPAEDLAFLPNISFRVVQ
jgi:hypothetical protein